MPLRSAPDRTDTPASCARSPNASSVTRVTQAPNHNASLLSLLEFWLILISGAGWKSYPPKDFISPPCMEGLLWGEGAERELKTLRVLSAGGSSLPFFLLLPYWLSGEVSRDYKWQLHDHRRFGTQITIRWLWRWWYSICVAIVISDLLNK